MTGVVIITAKLLQEKDLIFSTPTRPLVFCFPENSWNEFIPAETLQCEARTARQWEFQLRQVIIWGTELSDDRVIEPFFFIKHVKLHYADWGLEEERVGGHTGGSYTWKPSLRRSNGGSPMILKLNFNDQDWEHVRRTGRQGVPLHDRQFHGC